MLRVKVFKASETTIAGKAVTVAQLARSVHEFNSTAAAHTLVFDDYPAIQHPAPNDMVAGTVKLYMEGEFVIGEVTLVDSPAGNLAKHFLKTSGIQIVPVTQVVPKDGELYLRIKQLVIPPYEPGYGNSSVLRQMQDWIGGVGHWPMFDVLEDK
jgi:hypothetical protein